MNGPALGQLLLVAIVSAIVWWRISEWETEEK
jgi:hypothetical protein